MFLRNLIKTLKIFKTSVSFVLKLDGNEAVSRIPEKVNKCFQTFTRMKAVSQKGHLGCIEILKAKAAITLDRFCMNKAQQEEESQRKRGGGGEGNNEREVTVDYCLWYFTVGEKNMLRPRVFLKLKISLH